MDSFQDLFFDQQTIGSTQPLREARDSVPLPPTGFDDLFLTQAFSSKPDLVTPTRRNENGSTTKAKVPSPHQRNAVVGVVQPTHFDRNYSSGIRNPLDFASTPGTDFGTPAPLDITRKTPGGSSNGILKLRPVAEIPEMYQRLFPFPYFNAVQSKAFDDVLYTGRPVVICAPTGSGKTVLFELAIIRLLMIDNGGITSNCKVVYMAPIKALCAERFADWQEKFQPYGMECMELTGDTELDDYFELQAVNIIFTTPEKWDSMTRRWRSFIHMVRLYLIDEVHLLNDSSRGATMEAVVSRMKTVNSIFKSESHPPESGMTNQIRFLAVSATVPNADDVGAWLGTGKITAACHKLDDSHRPVRLRKVVLGFPCSESQSEFRFDLSLNYKLAGIIETYSEQKPTLVFCATRKSVQQAATTLVKDARFMMHAQQKARLIQVANGLRDVKLREVVIQGVAYHHAGLDMADRKAIEALFTAGELPVLISTSTLAMGVNLPAHLVVIKSTQHYVMGNYEEYSETSILQMIGRAGRPQFDTSATAVIMTRYSTKPRYECLVNGTQLVESSLHQNLVEHVNAEVVLGTIRDVSVALEWLKSTFLYIRIMKNPKHYDLSAGMTPKMIDEKLQELCLKNLSALAEVNLIQMEDDGFGLRSTEIGRLMARYCVAFETMKNLQAIKGQEGIADLLPIFCSSKEFKDIQLRVNEKRTLNTLNKDKNRATVRYPMEGKIKTNQMKVNCLIQAALGCLAVQEFSLSSDTNKIIRSAVRISKCLVEVLWQQSRHKALLSAVLLAKCLKSRLWENSHHISRQLPGIGDKLSTMLVNSGVTTFEKLEATNPREIELIINRHPPFGNQVLDSVRHLPKYELYIDQKSQYSKMSAEISVSITMLNAGLVAVKSSAGPNHMCVLLIGDSDNNVVYKARVSDSLLMKGEKWSKKIDVHRASKSDVLNVAFISQNLVGLDVYSTYTPFYLGSEGRRLGSPQNNVPSLNSKQHAPPSRALAPLESGFRQCSHRCSDKSLCAHDCCKTGVPVKNRSSALENYRRDLKMRATVVMQEAPPTKHFKPDLSHYKYTARSLPLPWPSPNVASHEAVYVNPTNNSLSTNSSLPVRPSAPTSAPSTSSNRIWDDIEIHRQRASATSGGEYEDLIYIEDDEDFQPPPPSQKILGNHMNERYDVEDFQICRFPEDDDDLPDICPPRRSEKPETTYANMSRELNSGSFDIMGDWESDDEMDDLVLSSVPLDRNVLLKEDEIDTRIQGGADPAPQHSWDRVFSQPTNQHQLISSDSDGNQLVLSDQTFHNDIFAGIF